MPHIEPRKRVGRCVCMMLAGGIAAGGFPPASHAAGDNTLTVSATVLSKSNCKFNSANSTLNMGAIDPSSLSPHVASTTTTFVCHGSQPSAVWSIDADDGLYASGPGARRMRHATVPTEFLSYSLNFPQTGSAQKSVQQTLTITGTVPVSGFQNAQAGAYSDTVVLTLEP